jgi:hypothetical protein
MTDFTKVDFYGRKSSSLPRFAYRRLAAALKGAGPAERDAAIAAALRELLEGADPDLRKFKFVLPTGLRGQLTPDEIARFEAATAERRGRAAQLKMVFPHVADEFGLSLDFLGSVLDLERGPAVPRGGRFFTIGSCFARNIAEFLTGNGVPARSFGLAEDLNSPISNSVMLSLMRRPVDERDELLREWTARIFPNLEPAQVAEHASRRGAQLQALAREFAIADCIVLTLGNVVDLFQDDADRSLPLVERTFPKFIAVPQSEDVGHRTSAAANLKRLGATIRMATYAETIEAIEGCLAGIRSASSAPIVVTLSPVPVDSAIGLASGPRSAIEVDCVSKSRLRSAFDDVTASGAVADVHYFPSFEIVRWIGGGLSIPAFGLEDAASRHVSSPILDSVCATFVNRYIPWRAETKEPA